MSPDGSKADRILDAAQEVLAVNGFAGLTIAKVAREAHVSRGLLHYYFDSKEDMLAKLLRRSTEESWEIVSGLMRESSSVDELADKLVEAMREYARTHVSSLSLLAEGLAVARNYPRIRDEMSTLHREGQDAFSKELDAMRAAGRAHFTGSARGLSTILIALFDGLGLELQTISALRQDEETWTSFGESLRRLLR